MQVTAKHFNTLGPWITKRESVLTNQAIKPSVLTLRSPDGLRDQRTVVPPDLDLWLSGGGGRGVTWLPDAWGHRVRCRSGIGQVRQGIGQMRSGAVELYAS